MLGLNLGVLKTPFKILTLSSLLVGGILIAGCAPVQNQFQPQSQSAEPNLSVSEYDRLLTLKEALPTELGVDASFDLEFMPSEGSINEGGLAQVYFYISQEEYSQESLYSTIWEKIGTVVKLANEYKLGTSLYITAEIKTKFLAGGDINNGGQPVLMVSLDEKARQDFPLESCKQNCELLVSSYDFNPIEDMTWLSDQNNGETLSPRD